MHEVIGALVPLIGESSGYISQRYEYGSPLVVPVRVVGIKRYLYLLVRAMSDKSVCYNTQVVARSSQHQSIVGREIGIFIIQHRCAHHHHTAATYSLAQVPFYIDMLIGRLCICISAIPLVEHRCRHGHPMLRYLPIIMHYTRYFLHIGIDKRESLPGAIGEVVIEQPVAFLHEMVIHGVERCLRLVGMHVLAIVAPTGSFYVDGRLDITVQTVP